MSSNLWSGECDSCIGLLWVIDQVSQNELRAKKTESWESSDPSVKPQSLEKVEWRFWRFSRDDESIESDEDEDNSSGTIPQRSGLANLIRIEDSLPLVDFAPS